MPWGSQQQQPPPPHHEKQYNTQQQQHYYSQHNSEPSHHLRQQQQQQQQPPQRHHHAGGMGDGSGMSATVGSEVAGTHQCVPVASSSSASIIGGGFQTMQFRGGGTDVTTASVSPSGFSARILDKREYHVKNTNDVTVVQLVEIIKKPGQSLGLYLREGNGIDKFTGVFASRFGDRSELERFGDVIRPGDELLNVNNSDVTGMSIDDVVLKLSIPRRLLLRIKYLKNRREALSGGNHHCGDGARTSSPSYGAEKSGGRVVVFQKSYSTDNNNGSASAADYAGRAGSRHQDVDLVTLTAGHLQPLGGGILSKPTSTAATWLGKRVRQQQRQQQQQQQMEQQQQQQYNRALGGAGASVAASSTSNAGDGPSATRHNAQQQIPYCTNSHQPIVMQHSHYQNHAPRVIDVSGRSMMMTQMANFPTLAQQQMPQPLGGFYHTNSTAMPNLLRYPLSEPIGTRRRHPPPSTIQPHPAYASATLGHMPMSDSDLTTGGGYRRPLTTVGMPTTSGDGGVYTRSSAHSAIGIPTSAAATAAALRPMTAMSYGMAGGFPASSSASSTYDASDYYYGASGTGRGGAGSGFYKSNSLPRRRIQSAMTVATLPRSVKWRQDVQDGSGSGEAFNNNPDPLGYTRINANPHQQQRGFAQMNGFLPGGGALAAGRTIADIFSAQEYKNWAGGADHFLGSDANHHRSRWMHSNARYGNSGGASIRSSSLPSKTILNNHFYMSPRTPRLMSASASGGLPPPSMSHHPTAVVSPQQRQIYAPPLSMSAAEGADILDRLHVSPLMNRRVPLRAAGTGFDVDRLSVNALYGILTVSIIEGRGLRIPEKLNSKQLYVVLEVNEVHRARTGISTPDAQFRWNETFNIDVHNAVDAQFFIYSWHPQLRHRFCHKGSLRLLDAFLVDQLANSNQSASANDAAQPSTQSVGAVTDRVFTLGLEPSVGGEGAQLLIRTAFADMTEAFRRRGASTTTAADGVSFGVALEAILRRDASDTPIVLQRLIREVEARGVDTPSLYYLCGATERKLALRAAFTGDGARHTDIGVGPVPDVNLLTGLVKDFLRELPQPLVPLNIYTMLADAGSVVVSGGNGCGTNTANISSIPNGSASGGGDREGNREFIMRIVDCLPTPNRSTLALVMDHLRNLLASEPHNGLNMTRLTAVFGPLLFCTAAACPPPDSSSTAATTPIGSYQSSVKVDPLSSTQAATTLKLLLEHWPPTGIVSSYNSSESASSSNASNTPACGGSSTSTVAVVTAGTS